MQTISRFLPIALALVILGIYHVAFSPFFSSGSPESTGIGHDFSGILPIYLDGYYWFLNNGFLEPPWFTPAFCAGQPCYADPQSLFYSLGQFLTFLIDPLTASYVALIFFSIVGYGGMYIFCRNNLKTDVLPATLAAALWIFNGFSTHHYLVGHVNFVAFLVAPLIAHTLLAQHDERLPAIAFRSGFAALLVFMCLHSGLGSLMITFALAILGLASLAILRGDSARAFYSTAISAAIVTAGLVSSKLVLTAHLMSNFPRSHYRLPGISDPLELAVSVMQMLSRPDEEIFHSIAPLYTNRDIGIGPHELAFDVTIVPAVLIVPATIIGLFRLAKNRPRLGFRQIVALLPLSLAIAIPLAINFYDPAWNAWLKSLPILSSTSAPWRWFTVFIPLVCAGTALALQTFVRYHPLLRNCAAIASLAAVLAIKAYEPRTYYHEQPYDPSPILSAYEKARDPGFQPLIRYVGTYTDEEGRPTRTNHQNDLIAMGVSQAYCYNPLFGYWLENFPVGTLRPGSPFNARDGLLNLKNPACYVFPVENNCVPGDHFRETPEDRNKAEAFVSYRPWHFNRPASQKVADMVALASLALAIALVLAGGISSIYRKMQFRGK